MPRTSIPTLRSFQSLGKVNAKSLNEMTEGFFFSPGAMRWFNSRIGSSRLLISSVRPPARYGLAVVVSSRFAASPRHYEVITICPYGNVLRSRIGFQSIREANKELNRVPYPYSCECAGCSQ